MRSGFYGYGFNVGVDIGGAHGAQPLRGVRARRRHELRHPAVRRRGDRRAHQRHAVRCARIADRRIRRPGAVRRGARGLVQALQRRLQADGASRRARWSASSRRPIPRQPRRWRPTSARTTTTTGARRGSPRRTASCNSRWAPKLDVPLDPLGRQRLHLLVGLRKTPRPGRFRKATFDGNKLTLEYYDEMGKGTFTR